MRLQFRPAPPETGIVFVRGDLKPAVRIPARGLSTGNASPHDPLPSAPREWRWWNT